MRRPRAGVVICGAVVVAASRTGIVRAEAVGIGDGRIVSVGSRADVLDRAAPRAIVHDFGGAAVVPGLHDFHIHLVGLARARAGVRVDDARDGREVAERLRVHAAQLAPDDWLTGRGWSEAQLGSGAAVLATAVGERPAFVSSHDGHSAWASPSALASAGISVTTPDPPGGRIERDEHGVPTGVLRETAMDLVAHRVPRLTGDALRPHLLETVGEMASLGLTGASEAGDYTDQNGVGRDAALGDSYSTLTDLADAIDGRLRLTLGIPVDALAAAAERGFRTGMALADRRTMRFGWAKEFADGALGSGTAALFEPHTCGDADSGILRVTESRLGELIRVGRRAGIGIAVHAIGDRAAAMVLGAFERAPRREHDCPPDRIEHAQLMRDAERRQMAALDITASVQPIHAAADRDLVEACWDGRQADAYAWRALNDAGVRLAAGSDAPVESVNPWWGLFAALHRRMPDDARPDWRPEQAMSSAEALAAYTDGPARSVRAVDEGHLRIGAHADLAVLSIDVDALLSGDERLVGARSVLTLVEGVEVHRA